MFSRLAPGLRAAAFAAAFATVGAPALPVAAHPFETAEIRNPGASFLDVAARMQALRGGVAQAPLEPRVAAAMPPAADCAGLAPVLPPPGPMVIPPRYVRGGHGPVNPAYAAAVALYRDFEDTAARLANQYVAYGRASHAACLLDHLHRWARADALTAYTVSTDEGASNQAWYQAEWSAAAAALALSQVASEPTLDAVKLAEVLRWLRRVSWRQIGYPGGEHTCCNNHAYWRGLHATAIGILSGDEALYRWGLGRYALAIRQLAPDGRWPLEMARKELALHYQNYALLPLVLIAEAAAQQGLDLYAYQVEGRGLHDAVDFLARALRDRGSWAALGLQAEQDLRAFAPGRGDQAWGEFYRARFGRDALGLLSRPVFNARTGGSATLLAHPLRRTTP